MDDKVYDIIIEFIKACKNDFKICNSSDSNYIGNCRYLLNQILRQYSIAHDHYYISKKAILKWNQITDESIFNYYYRDYVEVKKIGPITIKTYRGNSNKFDEKIVNKGDKFCFRDVFHDEHIVPIKMIYNELINLDNVDKESVKSILNKIYICRILKEEDRTISSKYKRSTNVNEVIEKDYKEIELISRKDYNRL